MSNKMKYRPDIDGLRAVAVLAVLFYHGGFKFFTGGFVGVDVFFVISGFLITKKIADEILENKFTLISFYEKRIRRIFPALFTTLFITLFIGAWLYDTTSFKELGQSATTTTLFVSNIFFWTRAGYFESPSILKPLLHMWSLSVEEQFYLVLPLLLVILYRFLKKHVKSILAAIAAISFIAVMYTLSKDPSGAFYLTHGRVWELLMGSILALSPVISLKSTHRNLLSVGGIILISTSILFYSHDTPFPGASAILPVLGSTMIIFSGTGGESLVGKILSTKPFVFIGKISYSLYLWHWPLLVFIKVYLIRPMTPIELAIWLVITFLVSFLSWKYIETPFRSLTFLAKPRIFYLAGSVMVMTALAGYFINYTKGLPIRFDPEQAVILSENTWNAEDKTWRECKTRRGSELVICPIGAENQPPEFILWGDSHANSIAPAVNLSAKNANRGGILIWKSGCPPLTGIDRTDHRDHECSIFSEDILTLLEENPEIKTVILSSRWAIAAAGTRYKTEEGNAVTLVDTENTANKSRDNGSLFTAGLGRTVDDLNNLDRQVILVAPVPEIGYDVPSAYFVASRTGRDINTIIAPTIEEYQDRNRIVLPVLADLAQTYSKVEVVDPFPILCNQNFCPVVADNIPLYSDNNHLSTMGAYRLAQIFDASLLSIDQE